MCYNPNIKCDYHDKILGHSIEDCKNFIYHVRKLVSQGYVVFVNNKPFCIEEIITLFLFNKFFGTMLRLSVKFILYLCHMIVLRSINVHFISIYYWIYIMTNSFKDF